MKTLFTIVIAVVLIGCSNPVTQYVYPCVTMGVDKQIEVVPEADGLRVLNLSANLTACDVWFYLPDGIQKPTADFTQAIPDVIAVGGHIYTGLSVRITTDVWGEWFVQILHNGGKLTQGLLDSIDIQNFKIYGSF